MNPSSRCEPRTGKPSLFFQTRFWDLFIASFGVLFFELLLIRWLPTSLYYLGYYKNCILFATFLGFGIGCVTRRRTARFLPVYGLAVALVVLVVGVIEDRIKIVPWHSGELIWPQARLTGVTVPLLGLVVGAFVVAAAMMIPLGQLVGMHLGRFPALAGYSVNIAASLLGVGAFLAMGYLQLNPQAWFTIAFVPFLYSVRKSRLGLLCNAAGLIASLAVLSHYSSLQDHWSPYSKITLEADTYEKVNARQLLTNNNGHQVLYDLRPELLATRGASNHINWVFVENHLHTYDSPYAVVAPKSVLIVGGGTGNEAAAALRHGVEKVHVVEIDPVIIQLGKEYHPENPYDDPRVKIFNDDARHYMATTKERYDLIIFGFLDSTSYLSSMSNIRLDNYVYTMESFKKARELLTSVGLLQVTYYVIADFVKIRLYLMLRDTFDYDPLVFELDQKPALVLFFLSGPAVEAGHLLPIPGLVRKIPPEDLPDISFATDDWPYLNLPIPQIGHDYLKGLSLMLLISLAAIVAFVWTGHGRPSIGAGSWIFFLQGMGFMLLETNTITRMALIMGSTWVVTSLAIILVLLAALLANTIVHCFSFPAPKSILVFLVGALAFNYAVGVKFALALDGPARIALAAFVVYLPILGSSLLFARLFQRSRRLSFDLGMNVLGALFGGMLEYISLIIGIRSIYLVAALVFLVLTLIFMRHGSKRSPALAASGAQF